MNIYEQLENLEAWEVLEDTNKRHRPMNDMAKDNSCELGAVVHRPVQNGSICFDGVLAHCSETQVTQGWELKVGCEGVVVVFAYEVEGGEIGK